MLSRNGSEMKAKWKIDEITGDEIETAINRIGRGRALDPDKIPIEVWLWLGHEDIKFALNQMTEKYREAQKDVYAVFINLEKAYDRVPRMELWQALRNKGVSK